MPYTGYMITWKSLIQAIRIIVKPGWLFLKGGRIAAKQLVFKDRRVKGESATPSKKKKLDGSVFYLGKCFDWTTVSTELQKNESSLTYLVLVQQ